MIGESTAQTRLCPALRQQYRGRRRELLLIARPISRRSLLLNGSSATGNHHNQDVGPDNHKRSSIPAKFIWIAAMLVVAVIAFFAGGYRQRSELALSSQANLKQLQGKDQMIQSQEGQLAQTRQQLNDTSNQLAEMKSKLEASQKELSLAKQRLSAAAQQTDHPTASRSPVAVELHRARRTPLARSLSRRRQRQTAAPGVYETTRRDVGL